MALEVGIFGGGCFWCTESIFNSIEGVEEAVSGYTGGYLANPTYKEVCEGTTGHAEVVKVVFNSEIISYDELLEIFWNIHNPTQLNRQGEDVGTQYRSSLFYTTEEQRIKAEQSIITFENKGLYEQKFTTVIEELGEFWPAEDYHQGYFLVNQTQPYCSAVVGPKIAKFKEKFKKYVK